MADAAPLQEVSAPFGRVLGVATEMHELVDVARARFEELNVSRLTIDEISGLANGYSAKILAGMKNMGHLSMGPILKSGAMKLVVVEDPEQLEKIRHRLGTREHLKAHAKRLRINPQKNSLSRTLSRYGQRGGKARVAATTPEQRSASARHAARVRWKNARTPGR